VSQRLAHEAKASEVAGLRLTFSSSFELEELSLEKSRSLKEAPARDIIFWNVFFFFLSPKWYFLLLLLL
jgi:hypothetical protein